MSRVAVKVGQATLRVDTYRASLKRTVTQTHRGYRAYIYVPGEQEPIKCCRFHQKQSAARRHGIAVGRAIAKERGINPPQEIK